MPKLNSIFNNIFNSLKKVYLIPIFLLIVGAFSVVNQYIQAPKNTAIGINNANNSSLIDSVSATVSSSLENLITSSTSGNLSFSSNTSTSSILSISSNQISSKSNSFLPATKLKMPILMYHHIDTLEGIVKGDKVGASLRVSPAVFEKQLQYIAKKSYTTINSFDLQKYLSGQVNLPAKPILLTFDDGYKNNFTKAFPLLQKYGMKADFAIISSVVSIKNEYMTWQDLRELVQSGMSISSHTHSHCTTAIRQKNYFLDSPINSKELPCSRFATQERLTTGQIKYEFETSKRNLERELKIEVSHLIYPFGFYNQQSIAIAKSAGYQFATTVVPQSGENLDFDKSFELPRYRVFGQQSGELTGFFGGGR